MMDWTQITSFAIVAALLVMSPGPNGVLIAKTVPTSGRRAGFANIFGFVAAFYLHGALSIFGISLLLVRSAELFFVFKMAGAAYLCWIGLKALRDAFSGQGHGAAVAPARRSRTYAAAFSEGFLTNALNPKVSLFYMAAFPQFISAGTAGDSVIQSAFILVFVHSVLNAVWFGGMVLLFSSLRTATGNVSFQRWLKGVTGIVFVGFGLKLATFRP